MSDKNTTPTDDPQDQKDAITKLLMQRETTNQSELSLSESISSEQNQGLEERIKNCTEFKEEIDKRVAQVISDVIGIKDDLIKQKEAKEFSNQFMTHQLDEYLKCFEGIDRDKLSYLFDKDLKIQQELHKERLTNVNKKMELFKAMLEEQKKQLSEFWQLDNTKVFLTPEEIFKNMKTISFGDKSLQPQYSYPELRDMPELLSKQTIKIDTVYFKANWIMRGMQFKFTENLTTKLLQTDYARNYTKLEQFSLDPTKRITQVSVYINDLHYISGLRFHYETGDYKEHKWHNHNDNNPIWETETIPDGYEIVGYFACVSGDRWSMFGYNLWPIDRKLGI